MTLTRWGSEVGISCNKHTLKLRLRLVQLQHSQKALSPAVTTWLKMYHRQPCVADDSYQLPYEHLRQLECAGHFRAPAEVSQFKFNSGKDEASESSSGASSAENGKRLWSHFWEEVVNKRARKENQTANLEHFDGNSSISILPEGKLSDLPISEETEWTRAAAGVGSKSFQEGYEVDRRIAGSDQLEDACFEFPDHSHWRYVSGGPGHQADLPEWTSRDSNVTSSTSYANHDEASDKWLGTRITAMPDLDSIASGVRSCYPMIGCDCVDEGSINCVRKHVMDAREKLIITLGQEEFIQMGFSHMGESVAQRWTEEEENLFHEVVSSNPESRGRNFWVVLQKAFPSSSFKDLVSYYFNVFVLRKRAHQNRFDRSNADSDNDEWQESGDVEFTEEGDEEEDDLPSIGVILSLKNDDYEARCKERLAEAKEDEGYKGLKSNQTMDGNSAEDEDAQNESRTSDEGLNGASNGDGEANTLQK